MSEKRGLYGKFLVYKAKSCLCPPMSTLGPSGITTMSMAQALDVWADLEDALCGEASHGYVTEIYAYRLVPLSPSGILRNPDGSYTFPEEAAAQAALAANNLTALVLAFCERREVRALLVEGRSIFASKPIDAEHPVPPFDHRVHVRFMSERRVPPCDCGGRPHDETCPRAKRSSPSGQTSRTPSSGEALPGS